MLKSVSVAFGNCSLPECLWWRRIVQTFRCKTQYLLRYADRREYLIIISDTFLTLHKTICCDPLSEPSHRDGSVEGSQHMVSMRNKKKLSSNTPSYLEPSMHLMVSYIGTMLAKQARAAYSPFPYHMFLINY